MWRVLFIAYLIAHGAVHLVLWLRPATADGPFNPSESWLLGVQRGLAVALAVVAGALLITGGIGLLDRRVLVACPWR